MNRRELIKSIKNLIKEIDEINEEADAILSGRSKRKMDDIRYSIYYINEFVEHLEEIKDKLIPINYGLGMSEPEPILDNLRDELANKYERMYELFDKVHYLVFKK